MLVRVSRQCCFLLLLLLLLLKLKFFGSAFIGLLICLITDMEDEDLIDVQGS